MIVKCIKNPYPNDKELSNFLLGKSTVILKLTVNISDPDTILIIDPMGGCPFVCDLENFTIIDSKIPAGWALEKVSATSYSLAHKEFLQDGFWEKFYDNDWKTLEIFEKVLQEIHDFHGLKYPKKKKEKEQLGAKDLLRRYGIKVD